ncbi:MAG: 3-deoxy-D-manno-octulosonic acid transferase [Octadecabacter sp.]
MIWVHCGDVAEVPSTLSLATRLVDHSDAMDVVITAEADVLPHLSTMSYAMEIAPTPAESPAKIRAFLDEWQPTLLIWNGGAVRPILLRCAEKAGLPATLINARNTLLFSGGSSWLPRATRNAVAPFSRILTADGATATRLTRGGVPRDKVEATGPILEEPIALPHDANELTVMVEALNTRPIWFAADIVAAEVSHIAAAHRAASRKNHRLLLLITPRDINSGPDVAKALRDAGFKVGVRSEGDDPEPEHQAYVADLDGELGLWYRIAPLTFLGGSLRGGSVMSPYDPIALGSAVVHGPIKTPHKLRFERLAQTQACREIRSSAELGIAVASLVSPEQTARMALAGWTEITRNADIINGLVKDAVQSREPAR